MITIEIYEKVWFYLMVNKFIKDRLIWSWT